MTKNFYIKRDDVLIPTKEDSLNILKSLPPAMYKVGFNSRTGEYYLQTTAPFQKIAKYYGDIEKRSKRIVDTFNDRKNNTGVLLTGEKGSGKSLLAKHISVSLVEQGVSTIIVDTPYCDSAFVTFMESIDEPVMIFIDEFEKVFRMKEQQEALLSLLDGFSTVKKMFLLTCNEFHQVSHYMKNRPGRIFYSLSYDGIGASFVREYCEDRLKNKSHIDKIMKLYPLFNPFNFDMLQAWVEEINRYDEAPQEALQYLNISVNMLEKYYTYEIKDSEGNVVLASEKESPTTINIFANGGFVILNSKFKYSDDEDDDDEDDDENVVDYWDLYQQDQWVEFDAPVDKDGNLQYYRFHSTQMSNADSDGSFSFKNGHGYSIKIKEWKGKKFDIRAL